MSEENKLTGKILGQFEIQEEIGRGGMASVYRARQKSMGRTVAVKILPQHLMHDPSFYERFEREVDVISHLEHPHILPIYDYGQAENIPYIAMRYLGGGSLEQWLNRELPALIDLVKPMEQIAEALDYAHRQGIIHRDLKPANIMLDEGGNAYLSDFGIARVLGSNLTGSMIVGTPAYMSPEQANGLPVDGRADIYSLGVMMFQLITGDKPFDAETPMAVLLKHINEPLPPIDKFRPGVPYEVNEVIEKATAKDPTDRYSSASDMIAAYREAIKSTKTENYKPTRQMGGPQPAPAVTPAAVPVTAAASTPSTTDSNITLQGVATRSPIGLAVFVILIIGLGIVIGGGVVMMNLGSDNNAVVDPNAIPTPFPRASTIVQDEYTISMPDEWIPPQDFNDQSQGRTLSHSWRADDGSAYVSLTILDAELTDGDDVFFRDAVDEYGLDRYDSREPFLELIDEEVAEDGSIRRSYWVSISSAVDEDQRPLLAQRLENARDGQVDIFFIQRTPYLVVVEMFTANNTQNTLVQRMQSILDSLRVSVPTSTTS